MSRRLLIVVAVLVLAGAAPGPATAATAPTGVTGIALDGAVDLAWQPVAGASAYNVYRGTSPTTITTAVTPVGGVAATGFTDTSAVDATTYYYAVRAIVAGAETGSSTAVQVTPRQRSCATGNAVVLENCFPGDTGWNVTSPAAVANGGIEAFATATSIPRTGSVALSVNSKAGTTFHVEIYRSGYYGGAGARLFSVLLGLSGTAQPACTSDSTTGLTDCSNWTTSTTITTTASWPSGVYLLRLVRDDDGSDTHVVLVVRDDARSSALVYGVGFTTYEAYNNYGGKSLYSYNSTGANTVSGTVRAVKVSFDRPFIQPRDSSIPNWYPRDEYPMVYWLESQGDDVSYVSDSDLETQAIGTSHKAFMTSAHDEYWSAAMRTAAQQARDAGVNLFFSGSNTSYWKIRFENGPSGRLNRLEVCYKTIESGPADPGGTPTTLWREPAVGQPENALVGQQYVGDKTGTYFPLVVSAAQGTDKSWRYTGLDTQPVGTSTSIGTALVGWEWDARNTTNGSEPPGVKTLATSSATGNILTDSYTYVTGTTSPNVTKYTAASGAIAFATGTNHWDWGLARDVDGNGEPDRRIQQATTNVLEDMGIVPATPSANITLDSATAPRVASTSPTDGASGVNIATKVTATFSRAMDATTITAGSFTLKKQSDGSLVAASVSYDSASATATLTPSAALAFGTTYAARLDTTVKASDGTPLQTASTWIFTTKPPQNPVYVNAGGPSYTSSSGAGYLADQYFTGGNANTSGATIAGTSDPALYQNERWGQFSYAIPVTNGTYDVTFRFVELYYAAPCSGKRIFSMDILNTPTSPDLPNIDICARAGGPNRALNLTVYSVPITGGVLNVKSVYGSADDPEVAAIDVVPSTGPPPPPTVTQTTPLDGATGVVSSAKPTATFSRAMDPSTITSSSFTLTPSGGTPVSATVAYDSSTNIATLTPAAALANSTTYTAKLDTTVKASDGAALAGAVTWTFTTAAATPPGTTVRINTGGPAYTAANGRVFSVDQYFTGGSTYSSTAAISGTTDPALYQDERWGSFTYSIPVANGTYDVTFHFVELYYTTGSCVGKRIFSMDITNTATNPDIANLDICAAAGGADRAYDRTIAGVTVSNGTLTIKSVYGSADDPEVAAIEVVPSGPADTQPPTAPTNLTATGSLGQASLSWTPSTDNVGVAKYDVYRSTTSGFTPSAANRVAQPTSTSYTDSGLAAGTYYYLVQAEDAAGNLSASSNQASATVTADTTPPSVSITSPAAGATISNTITVTASASDNVGVAGVQFKVDGNNIDGEITSAPYSVSWTTTSVANGSHTLTAVARDTSNNTTTSAPVTVTVSNTGPVGLVASYNFNAGSGTTVADLSGNGNNGTVANTTWSTAGKYGGALSFNGTSSLVTVPDANSLDLTTGMTLEAWVNPSALGTAWRCVLFKEQPGEFVYALYANQNTTRPIGQVFVGGEQNAIGTAGLTLNTWAHLAATYDGANLRLYVNGTLVQTTAVAGAIPTSTGVLHMGGDAVWGEYYNGLLDDVRIYNRALSAGEIQTDMNTPVP